MRNSASEQSRYGGQAFGNGKAIAVTAFRDAIWGEISRGALCLSCLFEIPDSARHVVNRVMLRDVVELSRIFLPLMSVRSADMIEISTVLSVTQYPETTIGR
jgi:hypothetical protein